MKNKFKILTLIALIVCSTLVATFVGCSKKDSLIGDYSSTISMSNYELKIEKGETKELYVGYDGKSEIGFKSSNESIMTVSAIGGKATVTAVSEGIAYVEVSVGGKSKTCKIIVFESEYKIVFDREESETMVWIGKQFHINAKVLIDGVVAQEEIVLWSVSGGECNVKTEGNYAVFTPTAVGDVTIIASFGDKVTAEFKFVAVNQKA